MKIRLFLSMKKC